METRNVDSYCSNELTHYPPIILIHGMFGGGWYFENWAKFLCEKGFRAYVIKDLHSVHNSTFNDYVNEVSCLLVSLAEDKETVKFKPIIIGHSMGGLITQKLAERYPHLVGGIVLVASAPPKGISAMSWSVAKTMLKHLPALMFNLPLKIDKKSTLKLLLNWLGDEDRKEQIFQKFVPESSRVAKQLVFSQIPVDEKKVVCKSLVVAGLYDNLLPRRIQIKIANKYDSVYLSFLKGHMMMLDDGRNKVINAIYDWIAAIER